MADRYDSYSRAQLERAEDWRGAIAKMPQLHFPKSWSVTIIPPFGGAMARFLVDKGGAHVSVYADFHEALGYYGGPHWEVYPGVSGENERFDIADTETMLAEVGKSLRKQTRRPTTKDTPHAVDSNTRSDSVGWLPIETAPKDGTPILLWATCAGWEETGFNRVVGYHDGFGWSIFGAGGPEPVSGHAERPNYRVQRLDNCNPTKWMPLPTPPALEERRG